MVIGGAQDELGVKEFDKLWDQEKRPDLLHAGFETAKQQMVATTKALVARVPSYGCRRVPLHGNTAFLTLCAAKN